MMTRPGNLLHSELANPPHFLAGKTHYFDWAMASGSQTVNVYQAG